MLSIDSSFTTSTLSNATSTLSNATSTLSNATSALSNATSTISNATNTTATIKEIDILNQFSEINLKINKLEMHNKPNNCQYQYKWNDIQHPSYTSYQDNYYSIDNIQNILNNLSIAIASHNYNLPLSLYNISVSNILFDNFSPSLLINSITNRRILFFGDSTTQKSYMFIVWCSYSYYINLQNSSKCIPQECQFPHNSSLMSTLWWGRKGFKFQQHDNLFMRATNVVIHSSLNTINTINNLHAYGPHFEFNLKLINSTLIFIGQWHHRNLYQLFKLYTDTAHKYSPDIIYFHPSGLHLTHLSPLRYFEEHSIPIILNYNQNLIKIYNVSRLLNSCLIIRSLSPRCECAGRNSKQFMNIFNVYHNELVLNNSKYINEYLKYIHFCVQNITTGYSPGINLNISNETILNICTNWIMMNDLGITHQNNLLKKFVKNAQNKAYGDYNKIFYYDRFNIFHKDCKFCSKNREAQDMHHWQPSAAIETMYFTNFINFAC